MSFTTGQELKPKPFFGRAAKRIERSIEYLGFIWPKVKWRFTDSIYVCDTTGERHRLDGYTIIHSVWTHIWVDITHASKEVIEDTMIHEAAHAVLMPVERACPIDQHGPVWIALNNHIGHQYEKFFRAEKEDRRGK